MSSNGNGQTGSERSPRGHHLIPHLGVGGPQPLGQGYPPGGAGDQAALSDHWLRMPESLGHLEPGDPDNLVCIVQGLQVPEDSMVPPVLLKHRILGAEEEWGLIRAYQEDGDQAALSLLVRCNQKLIFRIVSGVYHSRGRRVPLGDLFQEGQAGLIKTIKRFNLATGYRLSTYASYWIYQAASRASDDLGGVIRLPVHMQERRRQLGRLAKEFEAAHGRPPTFEELASWVDETAERVQALIEEVDGIAGMVSLDRENKEGHEGDEDRDGTGVLYGTMEDESIPAPQGEAERADTEGVMESIFLDIDPRLARVLRMRFGLGGYQEMTLEQIGARFGVTRERIRQLEKEALSLLRSPAYADRLRGLLYDYD